MLLAFIYLFIFNRMPLASCVDLSEVAQSTENFTGADLSNLMREVMKMLGGVIDFIFLNRWKFEVEKSNIKIDHDGSSKNLTGNRVKIIRVTSSR